MISNHCVSEFPQFLQITIVIDVICNLPESVDGCEVPDVPDVEGGVEDVHLLQLVDLRLYVNVIMLYINL